VAFCHLPCSSVCRLQKIRYLRTHAADAFAISVVAVRWTRCTWTQFAMPWLLHTSNAIQWDPMPNTPEMDTWRLAPRTRALRCEAIIRHRSRRIRYLARNIPPLDVFFQTHVREGEECVPCQRGEECVPPCQIRGGLHATVSEKGRSACNRVKEGGVRASEKGRSA
jgi:hypothetical protein